MDSIVSTSPQYAFVMVGINDISRTVQHLGYSTATATATALLRGVLTVLNSPRWLYVVTDEIFSNYTKIVEQLESKGINIFIQSTIQCVVDKCGSEKVRRVNELNQRLRAYAENSKSTFIDLGVLSDANGLDDSLSSDGVHLNGMGYRKWVDAIFPTVMKLGGK